MVDKSTSQFPLKKENQEFKRRPPLYSLDAVSNPDWKLFMWFASLRTIENCVNLFIVVWDANSLEYTREFNEETDDMIRIVEQINISSADSTNYSKILDNYRNYRHSSSIQDKEARSELMNNVWKKLESCGLQEFSYDFANQLKRLTNSQQKNLRRMILSRMKSFRSFARLIQDIQIKEAKKDNHSGKKLRREKFNSQQATPGNKSKDDNQVKFLLEENLKLKDQVADLVKENARQQAALGNLTNFSWNDDDPNNIKKLISDIEELQDMLDDFTMVQGNDYKINDQNAASVLEAYKCQAKYPSAKANLVLEAILRHHTIKTILEDAQQHLQSASSSSDNDPNINLESNIVGTIENLIKHMESFGDIRKGKDEITKITLIKIRQYAYSALSCRGFSNDHPLIKETVIKLLNEMSKFREIVDEETRNGLHDQAIQITRRVINIFCFRLKAQAFEQTWQFFQAGDDVDARLMQGAFSGQDVKNLEVEACGFPCIAILGSDNSNPKVFTKAKIITRPKKVINT